MDFKIWFYSFLNKEYYMLHIWLILSSSQMNISHDESIKIALRIGTCCDEADLDLIPTTTNVLVARSDS